MANTAFIRHEVATALADLIESVADSSTSVSAHDPGERSLTGEHIWVDSITGNVDYPAVGNIIHDDRFSIQWMVWVYKTGRGVTAATVAERCQDLMSLINEAVTQNAELSDVPEGVIDITLGNVDGPDIGPYQEGWGALATISVEAHTRLTRS